jgi:hypothetical protein
METIVIVTLGVMLIIALLQLRSKNFDNEVLTNKLNAEEKANASHILKNKDCKKQIDRLKSKLENQDTLLESKYKRALVKIVERDEVIRLRDLKIVNLEKTKKEYSARVYELNNEKAISIKETKSALKLCKESVATITHLRAELDSIEVLLSKYTPQPSLLL